MRHAIFDLRKADESFGHMRGLGGCRISNLETMKKIGRMVLNTGADRLAFRRDAEVLPEGHHGRVARATHENFDVTTLISRGLGRICKKIRILFMMNDLGSLMQISDFTVVRAKNVDFPGISHPQGFDFSPVRTKQAVFLFLK
jgi:hypothetical protein